MKGFGIGDFRGYFWNIGGPGQGRRIFVGAAVLYFAAGPHFGLAALKHLSALTGTFPSQGRWGPAACLGFELFGVLMDSAVPSHRCP